MDVNIAITWLDFIQLGIAMIGAIGTFILIYKSIKRKFAKPMLKCVANNKLTLHYDATGIGAYFILTVISKNCDCTITDIAVEVFKGKEKDSKIYSMKWNLLASVHKKTTHMDWGLSSTDRETMQPCPLYLVQDRPVSYGIFFDNEELYKEFQSALQQYETLGKDKVNNTLLTKFSYQEGFHLFDVILTDINGKKERFPHSFTFDKLEKERLLNNVTFICENREKELKNVTDKQPYNSVTVDLKREE